MWHAPSKTYEICKGTRIRIYDNGGKTIDRLSVLIYGKAWEKCACLALDGNGGRDFSQFVIAPCGGGKHLGKLISFESLPEDTQQHIVFRLSDPMV
jgi:hypothetical protein